MTDTGDYPEPPPRRATGEHPPARNGNAVLLKVVAAVLAALCVAAITWAVSQAASCSTVKVVDKYVTVDAFDTSVQQNNNDHKRILETINQNQQAILERLPLPTKRKGRP